LFYHYYTEGTLKLFKQLEQLEFDDPDDPEDVPSTSYKLN
jgi:hypothetical protein